MEGTYEKFKSEITADVHPVEQKFKDIMFLPNYANYACSTNYEHSITAKGADIRWLVCKVNPSRKSDTRFWEELYGPVENSRNPLHTYVMGTLADFFTSYPVEKEDTEARWVTPLALYNKIKSDHIVLRWLHARAIEGRFPELPAFRQGKKPAYVDWPAHDEVVAFRSLHTDFLAYCREQGHREPLDREGLKSYIRDRFFDWMLGTLPKIQAMCRHDDVLSRMFEEANLDTLKKWCPVAVARRDRKQKRVCLPSEKQKRTGRITDWTREEEREGVEVAQVEMEVDDERIEDVVSLPPPHVLLSVLEHNWAVEDAQLLVRYVETTDIDPDTFSESPSNDPALALVSRYLWLHYNRWHLDAAVHHAESFARIRTHFLKYGVDMPLPRPPQDLPQKLQDEIARILPEMTRRHDWMTMGRKLKDELFEHTVKWHEELREALLQVTSPVLFRENGAPIPTVSTQTLRPNPFDDFPFEKYDSGINFSAVIATTIVRFQDWKPLVVLPPLPENERSLSADNARNLNSYEMMRLERLSNPDVRVVEVPYLFHRDRRTGEVMVNEVDRILSTPRNPHTNAVGIECASLFKHLRWTFEKNGNWADIHRAAGLYSRATTATIVVSADGEQRITDGRLESEPWSRFGDQLTDPESLMQIVVRDTNEFVDGIEHVRRVQGLAPLVTEPTRKRRRGEDGDDEEETE